MKCKEITPQVREYLDDLLSEEVRKAVRSHLADCSTCRTYSLTIGTFAGELKKITDEIPVPAGFDEAVLAEIQKPESKAVRVSKISPKAIALGVSVFIAVISLLIYRQMPLPEKKPVISKMTMELGGEADLAQLKEIAENLGAATSELPAETASKPALAFSLQPLHWHLRFSEKRLEEKFISQLGKGIQMNYLGPSALVLTANREGFSYLLGLLESAEGLKAGDLVSRMKALPDFQGDIRISIVFETLNASNAGSLHWHLKFTLSNPFSLLDRLRETGFVPVFENPDFWIFQVSSDEFALLRDELMNSYGVEVEMSGAVVPPAGNEKFLISFYLQESAGGSV